MSREIPLGIGALSKDMLIYHQNGVELDVSFRINRGYTQRSQDYEDKCFRAITQDSVGCLIGPRLVDYLLLQGKGLLRTQIRPDAVFFSETTFDRWTLTDLFEFTTGKQSKTSRKLNGFSVLLAHLREDPSYLPNLFQVVLGDCISIPSDIVIPEDSRVKVTMVRPKEKEGPSFLPETDFLFTRMVIPLD